MNSHSIAVNNPDGSMINKTHWPLLQHCIMRALLAQNKQNQARVPAEISIYIKKQWLSK